MLTAADTVIAACFQLFSFAACLQERDPRWLVQHRDDGKNVNGWHWEEKNRLEWTKQRLRELLPAIPAAETGSLCISEVTDVVGEVREAAAASRTCLLQEHAIVA
jgi:hypothetical protein